MLIPTLILGFMAVILLIVGYVGGQAHHLSGLKLAFNMTIQILPLLFFALIIAGMIQALLPKDAIAPWIGAGSGLKGILLGTAAGALVPGGPVIAFPMVAGFLKAGAGVGTLVAFMTSWSLLSVSRMLMEAGILGWRFTMMRVASTVVFPPLAGIIAHVLFKA